MDLQSWNTTPNKIDPDKVNSALNNVQGGISEYENVLEDVRTRQDVPEDLRKRADTAVKTHAEMIQDGKDVLQVAGRILGVYYQDYRSHYRPEEEGQS